MAYDEFKAFILSELKRRKWNMARLAKESGITLSHISRIMSGERTPGATTAVGIARAFRLPPEEILHLAGLAPDAHPSDTGEDELRYLYRLLDDDRRHHLLVVARALVEDAQPPTES
ncbi:MAG: helix-turn-helix domain-containing protein [Armatimonadota bacterium]